MDVPAIKAELSLKRLFRPAEGLIVEYRRASFDPP